MPAVVILNTGIVHRVGHHRMYVSLSRKLAGAGHLVLRFDLSGIGDSEQRHDKLSTIDSSLADIREALDFLAATQQASRFVLIGLCSGADHAVLHGPTDPRVVGMVLMDPSIPPTTRYYVHYILQRLTSLQNWGSVAAGRSGLLKMLASQLAYRLRPRRPAAYAGDAQVQSASRTVL
jgi:dienelactone hydrolase